ncbi:MAG: sodium-independent anion transporter [Legionella sp.]|nr:MAG: sodium-independent anion transporter [Legionella sp.]
MRPFGMLKTIVESYHAGLFQRKNWVPNIISGIIVGVVALPLAMAFAIASGAKPEQGLYTAIIAGFLVSLFGGSRLQIAGPTGAFIVVLSGITSQYGIEGLQIATLMAGFLLFLMGICRLGGIIRFIPYPVIVGFTAGIAVVIWVGQWQYFFGLPSPHAAHFHEKLWQLLPSFSHLHLATTALGVMSLIVVLYGNKLPGLRRVPGPLLALVVATSLESIFHFSGVATIGSMFGGIPLGLPSFHMPNISVERIMELASPAFAIAMLGAIESLLSAVVADGMGGTRHDSNRELMGQGLANVVAPLFGGFAATGAIARTATNIRNGGNSPLSGVVHALTLLLVILCLAPLASNVPLSALAAILFVVAWNMSDIKHALTLIKRAPRADILILAVTFCLTIFVDLVVAVNIGVVLAVIHFLMRMSSGVEVNAHIPTTDVTMVDSGSSPQVLTYTIEGPIFFGAVKQFEYAFHAADFNPKVLIIRLGWVPLVDFTGLQALEDSIKNLQKQGIRVILCGAKAPIETKLRKAGLIDLIGHHNIFGELHQAMSAAI